MLKDEGKIDDDAINKLMSWRHFGLSVHNGPRIARDDEEEAITPHIPEKSFQMARYYGWYSKKSRGLRKKQGILKPGELPVQEPDNIEIIDVSDYKPPRMPSKKWRECIKLVPAVFKQGMIYGVGPLCCPKCGGEMKIISFIDEFLIIEQILEHLGLWTQKPFRDPPGRNFSPEHNELTYGPFYKDWPVLDTCP